MTRKQARDAVMIQDPGASNPAGVARALVESIDADRVNGVRVTSPATRLIAHQLIWLLTGRDIGLGAMYQGSEYSDDMRECRRLKLLEMADRSTCNPCDDTCAMCDEPGHAAHEH